MKKLLLILLSISVAFPLNAQTEKNSLKLPKVDGYELLKCDFHMHTVFSDGLVWPTTRVSEAVREGLDAIAITDHVEYRPYLKEFASKDHNRSYEIAKKSADDNGLILIRGTEVTRAVPPGHFNAIFIEDASPFETFVNKENSRDPSNISETLAEGWRQNGFVFWNHPWFIDKQNISQWTDIHEKLYKDGLIAGIEVVNGDRYDPVILQWCLDKNLTVLGNTDMHPPMVLPKGKYRTMTIVFAKERSEAAIKDALLNRRTVAYFNGNLYGKEELVSQIVSSSLTHSVKKISNRYYTLTVSNASGIPYAIKLKSANGFTPRLDFALQEMVIPADSEVMIELYAAENGITRGSFDVEVANAHIGADKPLKYTFNIDVKD